MPKPHRGEKEKEFMSRAIPMLMKEEGYPQKQAIAIAYSYWNDRHKKGHMDSITEDLGGQGTTAQSGIKHYKTHVTTEGEKHKRVVKKGKVFFRDGKPIGIYLKDNNAIIITEEFLKAHPGIEEKLKVKLENLSGGIAMYAAPAKVMLKKYYPGEESLQKHVRKLG